jgi:P pilus assembly chaperone PapD
VALTANRPQVINVNAAVGANHMVSAKVNFPGPGVAEREMHFGTSNWYGSTELIGATQPSTQWDFAEGSTMPMFSEYLSLQNPNPSAVTVDLHYMTDTGVQATKTLSIAAQSRVTVDVASGEISFNYNCTPGGPATNCGGGGDSYGNASCTPVGAGANCGVGSGIVGLAVQVKSRSLPIVAERLMYVNNYSFGSGPIRGATDAFGATAPNTHWYFAEGTTLPGFSEYLSLQNPGVNPSSVTLTYLNQAGGTTVKNLPLAAHARTTVLVSDPVNGVGPGVAAVSVVVSATQPIVAERPIYMVGNFAGGRVAGSTDVLGATSLANVFWFASGSTLTGQNDYLTIANPGQSSANVTLTYQTSSVTITRPITVQPTTRLTIWLPDRGAGAGPGYAWVWAQVLSDQPLLVEEPSYSSNPATYGATDTIGYVP